MQPATVLAGHDVSLSLIAFYFSGFSFSAITVTVAGQDVTHDCIQSPALASSVSK